MRWLILLTLVLLTGACASPQVSPTAICDGTRQARADHAAALLVDGGAASKVTGAVVLTQWRAGCGE